MDSTTFYCEICEIDFITYDSCVYDDSTVKCGKCGTEFVVKLKIKEVDADLPVDGGVRTKKEYVWA